jgi:hypothetical protein
MSYEKELQSTIQEHTNLNQRILEQEVKLENDREIRSRLVGKIQFLHELAQRDNSD